MRFYIAAFIVCCIVNPSLPPLSKKGEELGSEINYFKSIIFFDETKSPAWIL